MTNNTFQNTFRPDVVIMGLGATGFSAVRYLHAQGISLAVTDSRENPPFAAALKKLSPDLPCAFGAFNTDWILSAQCYVMVSPGISLETPALIKARAAGIPLKGDIAIFMENVKAPVIGITGSNGKSTVTTWVGELLKQAGFHVGVGGNLGPPALDLLAENKDAYVLELSSFQCETTPYLPLRAAAILNVTADHLDRYPSFESYKAAKQRIYKEAEIVFYNRADRATWPEVSAAIVTRSMGLDKPIHESDWGLIEHQGKRYFAKGSRHLIETSVLPQKAAHFIFNAGMALALAETVGAKIEDMLPALSRLPNLPYRCENLGTDARHVTWFNDSKATNIGATLAAVNGLTATGVSRIVLILGGVGKGADFTELREKLPSAVHSVILFGADAPIIAAAFISHGKFPSPLVGEGAHRADEGYFPLHHATTLDNVVAQAEKLAQPGDTVLFAPACASFDMFANYVARGEAFTKLVTQILCKNVSP